MLSNILDRIAFWSIFVTIVLLPLFFLPFTAIPIETSKIFLVVIGLAISVIAWSAARFIDGKIIIPKSKLLLSLFVFSIIALISALFSKSVSASMFGVMLDFGSFWFILTSFFLAFMTSLVISNEKKAKFLMKGLIVSSLVVMVFQIARFFVPNTLSLGIFTSNTGNVVGAWNSLGLFAGMLILISVFIFEFIKLNKERKIFFGVLLFASLLMIISINFMLIWKLLGIFTLLIFVYKLSMNSASESGAHKKYFPAVSFSIVMLSLLFFVSGQFIGSVLPDTLGLYNVEVNPSFSATFDVAKEVFKQSPLLGMGPNKFNQAWDLYKPNIINQSQFWNTAFVSGSSTITTLIVNTGVLGLLSLLAFFVLLIWNGTQKVFSILKDQKNHEALLYFIIILYLLSSSVFYSMGLTLFLLIFVFIGIFVGVSSFKTEDYINFSFLDNPRKSSFAIILLVATMITTAGVSFKYIEKVASVSYFAKTLASSDIEAAELSVNKALLLNKNDLYLRTYSQLYLSKVSNIVSGSSTLTDEEKVLVQSSMNNAINASLAAVEYNPQNYLNFEMLGFVYKNSASLGDEASISKSIEAYTKAGELNPRNPLIKLELARINILNSKKAEAKVLALESIALKPNFIQGLVLLAQLEKDSGNNTKAIEYAEQALAIAPTDEELINYVKSLKNNTNSSLPTSLEEVNTNLEE